MFFGFALVGCDTPVVIVDGDGGGQVVVVGGDNGQDGGDDQGSGGDGAVDGGDQGADDDLTDTESCTAKEDFPTVAPGDNVGDPFANLPMRDTYLHRESELLSCLACDGRELSAESCRFADGETNIGGEDIPAFIRTFSVEINDGEIIFHNDQSNTVIATGGINADGSFSAVGFEERSTNGIDTAQWRYVEGTFDFNAKVIEMFARTRDSASDFLGGGPLDYEYTTQSRYEAFVAP